MHTYLDSRTLARSLTVRDLTDPEQGPHAMQTLLSSVVGALARRWPETSVRVIRTSPIVPVAHNYDRLGFDPADITRDSRYTRYIGPAVMLRSHTSAAVPHLLETYAGRDGAGVVDDLLVLPGLVYRRDVVDRHHVGEPHQVDLWRLRSAPGTTESDLEEMMSAVVGAVQPGARWRAVPSAHPYTSHGRQIDLREGDEWLELAECGLIAEHVLAGAGLDPDRWSGLAMGLGLDRALMVRKRIPDIRYLRSDEPRIATQMQDLLPWRPVSALPPIRRDLSVVLDADTDDETIGDRVRAALGDGAAAIESIDVTARTPFHELPPAARRRLGLTEGQVNAVVRLVLRPLTHTLTDAEANRIRNAVYRAIHVGPTVELA